ncbi:MAG TPA: hypothetical protein DDY52_03920 [Candidatus Moranbacteria bacterium]|nr:MAG: hypothetical protein UR51_C0008G0085 [Candidatus Moranbacteria bacterium GW2011_GWF1_34_10]HBI17262.1 hypothetical protein [Candidatus Moranbacteria bacterium]
MKEGVSTKTAEENARKKRIDMIEIVGLISVMIALSSFVAASVIEIFRGTLSNPTNDAIELVYNFSPWSCGLLMLWGIALTTILSCIMLITCAQHKK